MLGLWSLAAGAQAGTEPTAARRRQPVPSGSGEALSSWGDRGRLGAFGIFLHRTVVRFQGPWGTAVRPSAPPSEIRWLVPSVGTSPKAEASPLSRPEGGRRQALLHSHRSAYAPARGPCEEQLEERRTAGKPWPQWCGRAPKCTCSSRRIPRNSATPQGPMPMPRPGRRPALKQPRSHRRRSVRPQTWPGRRGKDASGANSLCEEPPRRARYPSRRT